MRGKRHFIAALLGALFLTLPLLPQAGVYKWKDAQGRVHYSDQAPADGAGNVPVRLNIPSFAGPAEVSKLAGGGAKPCEVKIYTTANCSYCRQARAYLVSRKIRFNERDVEVNPSALEEFRRLGGRGVPVILIGEDRMDGFDEGRLGELLDRQKCG
jgi:glutaredoxin